MSGMSPAMRRRILARSLLLQSCWSFERMQGFGLAYCLAPWLEEVWKGDAEGLREAELRHQEYFNTQPYVAALVVGMVCALEEEAAAAAPEERPAKVARLKALKTAAGAALAGLGDSLFWGALRPFCAALSLVVALALWRRGPALAVLSAAGAYLLAHNAAALSLRWLGLSRGYEWGESIASRLQALPAQPLIRGVRLAGLALGLAACALMLAAAPPGQGLLGLLALAAFLGARALTARLSAYGLYAAACAAGAAASAAGLL